MKIARRINYHLQLLFHKVITEVIVMCYQTPGYSCGYMPMNNCCGYQNKRNGTSYALILVLFILLVIIGAARW